MPGLRVSMKDDNLVQVITFAHTWVTIANNTVHAIVIFLFNSIAREVFWKMIGWKKKNNSIEKKNTSKVSIIQVKPALIRRSTIP
uniref:Uncharacterized protein n=1 Tax=Acrobeloides nanus TaxID=290746 RepID=A0A914DDV6_9BILA